MIFFSFTFHLGVFGRKQKKFEELVWRKEVYLKQNNLGTLSFVEFSFYKKFINYATFTYFVIYVTEDRDIAIFCNLSLQLHHFKFNFFHPCRCLEAVIPSINSMDRRFSIYTRYVKPTSCMETTQVRTEENRFTRCCTIILNRNFYICLKPFHDDY